MHLIDEFTYTLGMGKEDVGYVPKMHIGNTESSEALVVSSSSSEMVTIEEAGERWMDRCH
ncbi:MAG: hypothetical protein ACREHG_07845 [Candidatus Saccharimonadales bacterium]